MSCESLRLVYWSSAKIISGQDFSKMAIFSYLFAKRLLKVEVKIGLVGVQEQLLVVKILTTLDTL